MAVGIVVIGGSIVGGIALAADRGRSQAPATGDSAVTVGNESNGNNSAVVPGADGSASPDAPASTTAESGGSTSSRDPGSNTGGSTTGGSNTGGRLPAAEHRRRFRTAGPTATCKNRDDCPTTAEPATSSEPGGR
jgi:hypothetical protein